jgi:tRNA nucleotidyltransferase (CCA-adding enzyme)
VVVDVDGELGSLAAEREDAWVPREPTAEAWLRWALDSPRPGALIEALRDSEELAHYPELAALFGVPQDPEWHPEGTVDLHTAHVLDAAAEIALREGLSAEERTVLMFAALTHDLGKPRTTELRDTRRGRRWTSYDHEKVGAPIARRFLERLGIDTGIVARVVPLVAEHMAYRYFADRNAGSRTVRRLAKKLSPATIRDMVYLIEADHSGRPPLPRELPETARRLLELAVKNRVLDGPPAVGSKGES